MPVGCPRPAETGPGGNPHRACSPRPSQRLTGAIAVASIENLTLIQPDGLTQARHLNIRHEGLKLLAFEEGIENQPAFYPLLRGGAAAPY